MKENITPKIKLLAMRTFTAHLFIATMLCSLAVAHDHYGQLLEQRITITLREARLETALKQIEMMTQVKFFYSIDQLNVRERISVDAVNLPLREVLNQLLGPHQIRYNVHEESRAITLKREPPQPEESNQESRSGRTRMGAIADPVSGKVTDAATRQPMAGVNVIIKGTTTGTSTDAEGRFTIEAEADDVLVFSFIGYKSIEIRIGERTYIALDMEEDVAALDEVEVYATGYDEVMPERTTGSYTHLGKELLERNVGPDLLSRLNGLTPALLIDQRSGQPFLNIRGRSTILANDQPLIVVDNFPYNGDINTINPNDIERITILKDAAAASIWGVRAGNGVIVITTKKGRTDVPLQVSLNTNITVGDKPDLFYQKNMSTGDFIDVEHMLFDQGYFDSDLSDPRQPPVSPVVEILSAERDGLLTESEADAQLNGLRNRDVRRDISKYLYQKSVYQQYALNVKGGSMKHAYYFSAGYDKNRHNVAGNGEQRITLNAQNTFHPAEKLEIDTRVVYTQGMGKWDNTVSNLRMGGRNLYPYARLTDDAGNSAPITYDFRDAFTSLAEASGFLDWKYNPIDEMSYANNEDKNTNLRAAAGLRYTIVKGLTAEAKYQYETQAVRSTVFNPIESYYTRNLINRFSEFDGTTVTARQIPEGGIMTFTHGDLQSYNGRANLSFNDTWNAHMLSAIAGVEAREIKGESFSHRYYGYDPALGSSSPVNYTESYQTYPTNTYATIPDFNGINGTIDRFRSYFANAAYTYDNRYTLSASSRIDQSNLFGVKSNQRSAPLWSAGGKWAVHRENFYKSTLFPELSIRATYGFNGNIDQNVTAFTTARFVTASYSRREAARLTNPPNPELRWEKTGMLNIGLDFTAGKDIISGSIEFYSKNSVDLIGEGPMDPTKGFDSFRGNIATMKGYGWDVDLRAKIFDRAFKWQSDILFSYAIDKITKYDLQQTSIAAYFLDGSLSRFSRDYTPVVDRPLFSMYSFRSAGLDPITGDPRGYLNGEPSADYPAMTAAASVDSLRYHGPALPPVFGAVRNSFTYRGWSLSVNIVYRLGYYFRRSSIFYNNLYSTYEGHSDFADRWQQAGDEASTVVPSMVYPADAARDAFYSRSEDLVERGDNLRVRDIRLGYAFANPKLGNFSFNEFEIYGYVTNPAILWTATKSKIDPDFPVLPPPTTYAVGIRTTF